MDRHLPSRNWHVTFCMLYNRFVCQAAGIFPTLMPGGKPGAGPSAPSGPASYPTMLAPKHPDERKEADRPQDDTGSMLSEPANGHVATVGSC